MQLHGLQLWLMSAAGAPRRAAQQLHSSCTTLLQYHAPTVAAYASCDSFNLLVGLRVREMYQLEHKKNCL